jgi:gas vesicle protein
MQHVHHEVKTERKNTNVSPIAAGLTGIIIGAASVAALALSDQETRKKATKKALHLKDDLQKWSNKTISDIQHRGEQMRANSKTSLDTPKTEKTEVTREVKERLDETDPLR